jgi:hypothetical protein
VRGFTQRPGVDFSQTYLRPATIRTLVAGRRWPVRQLDVSSAFLHGYLDERVLCQQPVGFVDPEQPDAVCKLSKLLYVLRQAPRAWLARIAGFLRAIGFVATRSGRETQEHQRRIGGGPCVRSLLGSRSHARCPCRRRCRPRSPPRRRPVAAAPCWGLDRRPMSSWISGFTGETAGHQARPRMPPGPAASSPPPWLPALLPLLHGRPCRPKP